MTMEASTPARAATARIVVCSYPRAANVVRAASRMARREASGRGKASLENEKARMIASAL
jgi:hypothetical protein